MDLFSFFKKSNTPLPQDPIARAYLDSFAQKLPGNTSVRDLNFVVLDTETSGLDPKTDSILSIAAIPVRNFQADLSRRFEAYLYHDSYSPNDEVKVHGILSKHLQEGRQEKEVLRAFLRAINNSIIVGHHISFDIAILNEAIYRHFKIKLKNKSLDTARLANRVENPLANNQKPASLDQLCRQYDIPLGERHTAEADAYITSILFMKLLGRLEQRKVRTMRDLLR